MGRRVSEDPVGGLRLEQRALRIGKSRVVE